VLHPPVELAPEYGVQQLPRNSNERLETSFLSSQLVFEKGFCVVGSQRDATSAGM